MNLLHPQNNPMSYELFFLQFMQEEKLREVPQS